MLLIMLTILMVEPIAPTVFWGPMAFAIMGGLSPSWAGSWSRPFSR
jgi:hypothetical protein